MALMEISIVPLGTGETSLSRYVAQVIRLLRESGLSFKLHDMGTTVEGQAQELFQLASRLHESVFSHGVDRVYTVIKIDDRRDKKVNLGDKVDSVQRKL